MGDVSTRNPSASFEMLLVMTALGLMDDKQSKAKESGGEILEKANLDHEKQLSSITSKTPRTLNWFQSLLKCGETSEGTTL